jgi:hypothetical protein
LYKKKDKSLIGETDFDLSIYANKNKATGDKLFLKNGPGNGAYIEIFIKAKASDQPSDKVSTNTSDTPTFKS